MVLTDVVLGVFGGALAMGFVDYFVHRHHQKRIRQEASGLKDMLTETQHELHALRAKAAAAATPTPALNPLLQDSVFAHSMPQTQTVTTGSPEYEAVKSRIGEIMAQNVVLQTRLKELETLQTRLRELEPAIHSARSKESELVELRLAHTKLLEEHTGLQAEHQALLEQVGAIKQAIARAFPGSSLDDRRAFTDLSATEPPHVDDPTQPNPAPTEQGVGTPKPNEGQTTTPLVSSPPAAQTAAGTRLAAPGLTVTHVVPQRDSMGREPLTRIQGLTALHQAKLFAAGIHNFADLCQASPARIREIVAMDPYEVIDTEGWVRQAAQIAYGLF